MSSAKKPVFVSRRVPPLEEREPCAYLDDELNAGKQTGMSGPALDDPAKTPAGRIKDGRQTLLSAFVRERLCELGMRQSEFCRKTGFDQGLLSKIQSSLITNLSLESVLRLSVGLSVSPQQILALIGRGDLHKLMRMAYPLMALGQAEMGDGDVPVPVRKISQLAMQVYESGCSLTPVMGFLYHLATCPGERPKAGPWDVYLEPG